MQLNAMLRTVLRTLQGCYVNCVYTAVLALKAGCCCCRYLVSQDTVVPVKALTDTLSQHFPQYKFAKGKGAEVKKVINNSKVQGATFWHSCLALNEL